MHVRRDAEIVPGQPGNPPILFVQAFYQDILYLWYRAEPNTGHLEPRCFWYIAGVCMDGQEGTGTIIL